MNMKVDYFNIIIPVVVIVHKKCMGCKYCLDSETLCRHERIQEWSNTWWCIRPYITDSFCFYAVGTRRVVWSIGCPKNKAGRSSVFPNETHFLDPVFQSEIWHQNRNEDREDVKMRIIAWPYNCHFSACLPGNCQRIFDHKFNLGDCVIAAVENCSNSHRQAEHVSVSSVIKAHVHCRCSLVLWRHIGCAR